MSGTALYIPEAVKRLSYPTLKFISLIDRQHTDSDLTELVDCLLIHPDIAIDIYLPDNRLTDKTGIKLAQYIASSSTLKAMTLESNRFGEATYLAIAAALRINTSLQSLYLDDNLDVDKNSVNIAFVNALILNPNRPTDSVWRLYSWEQNEFPRLKRMAEKLGHPSMQALLATQLVKIIEQ